MGLVASLTLGLTACSDGDDDGRAPNVLQESCGEAPTLSSPAIRAEGVFFEDALGRATLVRGVNAGGRAKFPPFFPFPFAESGYEGQEDAAPFDDEMAQYIDKIEEWGLTAVRLPFSWEAVEPVRGEYDAVFTDRLVRFAQAFSDRDIRVILDFHQDVFSRSFCGDGFPLWAQSDPERPIPPIEECDSWFMQYMNGDNDVGIEFARFWENEDGLQDALMEMWRHVIQATAHVDGVVGAELINEPWEGPIDQAVWAKDYLKPLLERFYDLVQEERAELVVFFGSAGTDTATGNTAVHKPERDGVAFAPHFYDPTVYVFGTSRGIWNPPKILGRFWDTALEWNVPVLVGETGCRTAVVGCDRYTRAVFETLDSFPMHATHWEYSATIDDWNDEGFGVVEFGGVERPAADELVRVYPLALAGTWGSFVFDREALRAELSFDARADEWSEVVVPSRLYPDGVHVAAEGARVCVSGDASGERLLVRADEQGPVTLTITAR